MKSVFLDTNVIIDLLADRIPFSKEAERIFNLAQQKQLKLYVSAQSFVTVHYVLKKYMDEKQLRSVLAELLNYLEIIPITKQEIDRSLNSKFTDFEDAIKYYAAISISDISCIITRNLKDFKHAEIHVLPPDQFML